MQSVSREKAENYARYRLPYSDDAAQFVCSRVGAPGGAVVDVGAGTGLLTRHFVGRMATVYAVEPEPEMRTVLERDLESVRSIDGVAEATRLPDQSVDLIVVGNAYHRFDPEPTRAEFARILRPGGWLALFAYRLYNLPPLDLHARFPEWHIRQESKRHSLPPRFFYGQVPPEEHLFRQTHQEGWPEYWGATLAGMEAPDPQDPWFEAFEAAHRDLFTERAINGIWTVEYGTAVVLARPQYSAS